YTDYSALILHHGFSGTHASAITLLPYSDRPAAAVVGTALRTRPARECRADRRPDSPAGIGGMVDRRAHRAPVAHRPAFPWRARPRLQPRQAPATVRADGDSLGGPGPGLGMGGRTDRGAGHRALANAALPRRARPGLGGLLPRRPVDSGTTRRGGRCQPQQS